MSEKQNRFEYSFVTVELRNGFMRKRPAEDYQEIIRSKALEGWRFVQIFAPAIAGYGMAASYELIFERKTR